MPSKLKIYSITGATIFDSSVDRLLSYIKDIPYSKTINTGSSGYPVAQSFTIYDGNITPNNTLIICDFVSTTPAWIVGGSQYVPYIQAMTKFDYGAGSVTVTIYCQTNTNIVVNMNFKVYRR